MNAPVLLTAAAMLGALSFFEPCTIATHTLFSARSHGESRRQCCEGLIALWVSRSLLAVGLLVLAVLVTQPPQWGAVMPSVVLAVMASVYLVSRFLYIPVPHLEFHKLLPNGRKLPHAMQLGLTLPACTLPLFVIILALAITLDSPAVAVIAGLLFASLFTLPTAIAAITGLSAGGRRFLRASAVATPFITAVLLFGAAIYLWPGDWSHVWTSNH